MFEDTEDTVVRREDTLQIFRRWLLATDPQELAVLFFYDQPTADERKGGIGKSWLLRQCVDMLKDFRDVAVVRVDFFSIRDRSGIEIARRVLTALQGIFPHWQPTAFERVLAEQIARGGESDAGRHLRYALRQALLEDLDALQELVGERRKRLIVFCDTYERVQMHPAQVSLAAEHLFPDLYERPWIGFVIAGRDKPDEDQFNWRGRAVHAVPVGPFTKAEMVLYIQNSLEVPALLPRIREHADVLFARTGGGRPILVGLMTDMFNQRLVGLEELLKVPQSRFEEALVLYLDRLEGPVTWAVLFMAHVYHRFRPDILDELFSQHHLWPDSQPPGKARIDSIWTQLQALSSVRSSASGEEIVLHDEMRRLVREWNLREKKLDEAILKDLSKTMIAYYERLLASPTELPLQQVYSVERLYHQCYLKLADGFAHFLEEVQRALRQQQNIYARSLIQEMDEFKGRLSARQAFQLKMQDARLLQNEEHAERALLIYEGLDRQAEDGMQEEERAGLFYEWGVCLTTVSRYAQAIYRLTNALEIYDSLGNESRSALISVRLGFAYRRQGNLDAAVRCYQQSLNIYRIQENPVGYTDSLNALGEVRLLQGEYDRALLICSSALQRRQELLGQGEASKRGIAFVQSNMGKIYFALKHREQAEVYFQRAYRTYEAEAYQEGIAISSYYAGQLALEQGHLNEARAKFEQACMQAGSSYPDIEMMSLCRWGQACALQKRSADAAQLLRKASMLADTLKDFYHRALSLLYLSSVLLHEFPIEHALPIAAREREDEGEREATAPAVSLLTEAHKALEEAERLATTYRYDQIRGWIMKVRGDRYLRARNYTQAFFCYVDYTYSMAKYNQGEYATARRYTLMEAWMSLPRTNKRAVYDQVKDDWYLRDLPEDVHALLRQDLERVQAFVDF
ncbi:MAG TPA: tetratricopeptide repeat protein [Ktedonobacteraceae bacterium]